MAPLKLTNGRAWTFNMTSSTALTTRTFNGTPFAFRQDGWFNMTQAAKHFGKEAKEFLRLPSTLEYIDAMQNVGISHLYDAKQGRSGGTFAHPKLAVFFARWLDVRFAVWCDAVAGKEKGRRGPCGGPGGASACGHYPLHYGYPAADLSGYLEDAKVLGSELPYLGLYLAAGLGPAQGDRPAVLVLPGLLDHGKASPDPLPNHLPFKLSEHAHHLEHGLTARGGGVDALLMQVKVCSLGMKLPEHPHEVNQ